jgi:diguanylate cyclase
VDVRGSMRIAAQESSLCHFVTAIRHDPTSPQRSSHGPKVTPAAVSRTFIQNRVVSRNRLLRTTERLSGALADRRSVTRVIQRVLPLASQQPRRALRTLACCFGLLLVLVALTAANALFGVGGRALQGPIRDWVSSAIYVLVAAIVGVRALRGGTRRAPWAMFAAGLSLYALGNVLWSLWIEHLGNVPIPSICDALWLLLYPLCYVGIVGLARDRGQRRLPAGVWLDGLIAGAGLAALGAVLLRSVLDSATGGTAAVLTELAYPVGDLLLAALMFGVLALRGWRLDRSWALLAGGFVLLAIADSMYMAQVADGSSSPSPITNLAYVVAVALLAFAAWQGDREPRHRLLEHCAVLIVPACCALTALGLLVYDHFHRLDPAALVLVIVTLLAAIGRTVITFRDVRSLAEARRIAATDDLTLLPNRRAFMRRADAAITAARIAGGNVAVAIIDLDNFKELNDTLGHRAGDLLLQSVGPRIQQVLRSNDTVARLGGDEFAILLDPKLSDAGCATVAKTILRALREPFEVQDIALRLTASIGLATFPADASGADELIQRADVAMYQAKVGRDAYAFYARALDTNSRGRLALAAELAAALEAGGIEVHFQPIATARSRTIVGVEALVRWRRADGELLMPAAFVGVAEQAGLSRALTRNVLALSLSQLAVWLARGHELYVAVNTTVADLLDVDLPSEVSAALAAHDLPPSALILEVTESSVLSDPARIGNVLARLGELGIGLSLDDFGTGYSSLTHLRTLPVGEVKVDRSFVGRMCSDTTDAAIVHAIVELAHKLGIRVVAEGVEDEDTWAALDALGCELVQGYALGRPVPATELELPLETDPCELHAIHHGLWQAV